MEYHATAKYIRMSTRKLRFIADSIRSLPLTRALDQLMIGKKRGASVITDVIRSAIDNAKQKGSTEGELKISKINVMGGPTSKRWHAVSRGMAHPYKKRMTHVRVVLADTKKEQ